MSRAINQIKIGPIKGLKMITRFYILYDLDLRLLSRVLRVAPSISYLIMSYIIIIIIIPRI